MIGVGIFIYPTLIANNLPHPFWFLAVWIIGGLIALAGALSSAELGSVFPEVGGDYAYLRNIYGLRWAFLYGFLTFFITYPGSLALGISLTVHFQLTTLFGNIVQQQAFLIPLIDYPISNNQLISASILLFLTSINHFGIKKSLHLQKFVTLIPLIFLVVIYVIAISIIGYKYFFTNETTNVLITNFGQKFEYPNLFHLGVALVPVYWTFTGWNSPLSLGAEIKNPKKVIPLVMIAGPVIVTFIYFLFALVFLCLMPYNQLQSLDVDPYFLMGKFLLAHLFSSSVYLENYLPSFISLLIFLLVIGNMNSTIVSGSRIYVALAKDNIFWKKIGKIDPKTNTPVLSIWLQSMWATVMIFLIDKESNLLNLAFIALMLLSMLTIFSIFLVRLKNIQKDTLYKTFGYPFTPIFYIVASGFILLMIILNYVQEKKYFILSMSAFSILSGLILFEFWKRYRNLSQSIRFNFSRFQLNRFQLIKEKQPVEVVESPDPRHK